MCARRWLLGYLAGVSVNCRGDLESLNETTATNGTEFQAFLDANGIDFLTSNGEPDLGESSNGEPDVGETSCCASLTWVRRRTASLTWVRRRAALTLRQCTLAGHIVECVVMTSH